MAHDGQDPRLNAPVVLEDLLALTEASIAPVERILGIAKARLEDAVTLDGRVSGG